MKIVTLGLVFGFVTCGPASAVIEPPQEASRPVPTQCHPAEGERAAIQQRVKAITASVSEGSKAEVRLAASRAVELLQHRIYRTDEGRPAAMPSTDPAAFLDWWSRGGESWMQNRAYALPDIESPPTPRFPIDSNAIPEAILCAEEMCDPLASRFIDTVVRWGLVLEEYENGRAFSMHQKCESDNAQAWRKCVSAHRSVQASLPLGDFRFPASGWLFVSLYGLLHKDCPSYFAFNLESGEALMTDTCDAVVGHSSVERVRELALVTLLAGEIEEVVQWQRFLAPTGMDLSGTCALDSAPPAPRFVKTTHARLSYWWWREGIVEAHGVYKPGAIEQPGSGLALKLLRVAEYTVVDGEVKFPAQIQTADSELQAILASLAEVQGHIESQD